MSSKIAIGIDLGTTYSCVGVWRNDKVEIISNEQGNRTTPSYVAFTPTDHLIGDAAKSQVNMNPTNTIFDAKRLIGRKFTDATVQDDIKHWPFKVVNVGDKPFIEAMHEGSTRQFSPEQISSMVLTKMKQVASTYLGEEITDAVITVPAYFNDAQRQATKDAGRIAGLNVMRIINEPTAAALAYGLDKKSTGETNVLIFDCGGGTHDVSLLAIEAGLFEVKATAGNSHLGGEDFDNILVKHCVDDFKKRHQVDITSSVKSLRKLRTYCERAKRTLSAANQATVEIDSLYDGIDYSITITRSSFEMMCDALFKKTFEPVEKVLIDSGIDKRHIHEIVLVGGSTRIPKIRQMLSEYFGGKQLNESVNPDEAVAYGAAIQAAILSGNTSEKLNEILLLDVTPLSLGLETAGGIMANIIDRNSSIPCKKSQTFSTASDNQPAVTIKIYEGERRLTKDNNLLGTFDLENIPPAPRGVPKIEVTFDLDANGILNVTAQDTAGGESKNITITNNKGRFSEEQIKQMIAEAKEFEEADNKRAGAINAKNELENYALTIKQTLSRPETSNIIDSETREQIEKLINDNVNFIYEHATEDKETYEARRKELEDLWNPIAVKMYAQNPNTNAGAGEMPDMEAGGTPDMSGMGGMPDMSGMGGMGGMPGMPDMAKMAEMFAQASNKQGGVPSSEQVD